MTAPDLDRLRPHPFDEYQRWEAGARIVRVVVRRDGAVVVTLDDGRQRVVAPGRTVRDEGWQR